MVLLDEEVTALVSLKVVVDCLPLHTLLVVDCDSIELETVSDAAPQRDLFNIFSSVSTAGGMLLLLLPW